jgi:26S proteasome regulatory subunit N12
MSERDLHSILKTLKSAPSYNDSTPLLSRAKITLLKLHALTPQTIKTPTLCLAAREVFEAGALLSIRGKDPDAFTRYVHQLTPFYELPASRFPAGTGEGEKNKITGLYLLLLLTQGNYAGFHTELEGLELRAGQAATVEEDRYLGYPIKLERWLMEGSYDLVWKAMASKEVPSEEYAVFSTVCSLFLSIGDCEMEMLEEWDLAKPTTDPHSANPQRNRLVL